MTLSQQLLAHHARPAVIKDLVVVVQEEVSAKKGVSGVAVRAGYGAASKVVPNLTERALDRLLPDLALALDPYWKTFTASGTTDFGGHLVARGPEVSAALLAVTDAKVEGNGHQPLKKAYRALRGKAADHVQAALPRLGAALQKHTSASH